MVVLPLSSQPVAVGHGTWHQHSGLRGRPATASALSFHLMNVNLAALMQCPTWVLLVCTIEMLFVIYIAALFVFESELC